MHRVSGVDGVRSCDARNAADALEGATRTTAGVLSMEPWLRQALPNLTDRPWEALVLPILPLKRLLGCGARVGVLSRRGCVGRPMRPRLPSGRACW